MAMSNPTVLDIYTVAAAILIESKVPLMLWELCDEIQATRLTQLGNKGDTPERTLAGQLSKSEYYFNRPYKSAYEIYSRERALESPSIVYAHLRYREWKENSNKSC